MITITLEDREYHMLEAALKSYFDDFGHEEADVQREARELLAKVRAAHGSVAHSATA